METVKLELPNGQWVIVFAKLTHGARMASQERMPKGLNIVGDIPVMEDGTPVDLHHMEKAHEGLLLKSIIEWSYGPKVEAHLLETMAEEEYQVLLQEVNGLYSRIPLALNKDGH